MGQQLAFELDPIAGFLYQPAFLTAAEEAELLGAIRQIEFNEVRMHGVVAKRRVMHYGWHYQYSSWQAIPGEPIPSVLLPVRSRLAEFAGVTPDDLAEALVTEYTPGAGIGWHRDAPMFGIVAAVSLAGACRMRFRRGETGERETREHLIERRSAYAITGQARSQWQHSIPPAKELRYSITFRTLRRKPLTATAEDPSPDSSRSNPRARA